MVITCPVCQAVNSTPDHCRRCKADLSLLWSIELDRKSLLGQVRAYVREKKYAAALATLEEVTQLRGGLEVDRIKAAICLLAGDYVGAVTNRPRE